MIKRNNYIKLQHQNPDHSNTFIVNWMLGNTCNYTCSYCPDRLHNGSNPWLSYKDTISFCNKILSHYADKKIVFEFTGGEITMWPDFIAVAKYLHEQQIDISIISNGSRTLRWWQEAVPYLKRVHLSFHPKEANAEHFEQLVAFLRDKVSLHTNIMMLPESFDTCNRMAVDLEEKYSTTVSKQPLLINLNGAMYNYTKEQLQILSDPSSLQQTEVSPYRSEMTKVYSDGQQKNYSSNQLISSFENSWNNWQCNAGIEQLIVTVEGDIYRGWCMTGGKIGNIHQDEIHFPTAPISCDKYECSCNFDIMCTKIKLKDNQDR